jgi:hypothetical protein
MRYRTTFTTTVVNQATNTRVSKDTDKVDFKLFSADWNAGRLQIGSAHSKHKGKGRTQEQHQRLEHYKSENGPGPKSSIYYKLEIQLRKYFKEMIENYSRISLLLFRDDTLSVVRKEIASIISNNNDAGANVIELSSTIMALSGTVTVTSNENPLSLSVGRGVITTAATNVNVAVAPQAMVPIVIKKCTFCDRTILVQCKGGRLCDIT